jgi:hypothetical protein
MNCLQFFWYGTVAAPQEGRVDEEEEEEEGTTEESSVHPNCVEDEELREESSGGK